VIVCATVGASASASACASASASVNARATINSTAVATSCTAGPPATAVAEHRHSSRSTDTAAVAHTAHTAHTAQPAAHSTQRHTAANSSMQQHAATHRQNSHSTHAHSTHSTAAHSAHTAQHSTAHTAQRTHSTCRAHSTQDAHAANTHITQTQSAPASGFRLIESQGGAVTWAQASPRAAFCCFSAWFSATSSATCLRRCAGSTFVRVLAPPCLCLGGVPPSSLARFGASCALTPATVRMRQILKPAHRD